MNIVSRTCEHLNAPTFTVFSLAANACVGSEFLSISKDVELYYKCGAIPLYVMNFCKKVLPAREE